MWARIEDDIVLEIVTIDPAGRYHPSLVWVECGPEVKPGWQYKRGEFSQPIPMRFSLEEARAAKIMAIDAETSASITSGFDYTIKSENLHFSYEATDQQNFADTASAAILAQMGVPDVPRSVTWNGWRLERDADGKTLSRSLVRLDLTIPDFLGLYMAGALAHKAACMERGGQRKAAVEAAQTLEDLQALTREG